MQSVGERDDAWTAPEHRRRTPLTRIKVRLLRHVFGDIDKYERHGESDEGCQYDEHDEPVHSQNLMQIRLVKCDK